MKREDIIRNSYIKSGIAAQEGETLRLTGSTARISGNRYLRIRGTSTVAVSLAGIEAFNRTWPCSELRHAVWFQFESNGDLVDTNIRGDEDGMAASALAGDCQSFLRDGVMPSWAAR